MGRVDDAMRRAAGEQDALPPAADPIDRDAEALAEEPFPLELRPRTASPAHSEAQPPAPAGAPPGRSEPSVPGPAAHDEDLMAKEAEAAPVSKQLSGKLVADQAMPPGSREQYRRLAATLHHTQAASGVQVVMIASAVAGEGKTLTAANLSLTFSESYRRRVLLIDGDLRRPSLHAIFNLEAVPGLSDVLAAAEQRTLPVHQVSECLSVLSAGRPTSDPMAGLTSERMHRLIAEARERFDWIIVDTPPVGLITDANLLAAMVDGAVLVVKAGTTPYTLAQRAIEAIGRDRLLGAVLNRATVNPHGSYYYYNYSQYYGARST